MVQITELLLRLSYQSLVQNDIIPDMCGLMTTTLKSKRFPQWSMKCLGNVDIDNSKDKVKEMANQMYIHFMQLLIAKMVSTLVKVDFGLTTPSSFDSKIKWTQCLTELYKLCHEYECDMKNISISLDADLLDQSIKKDKNFVRIYAFLRKALASSFNRTFTWGQSYKYNHLEGSFPFVSASKDLLLHVSVDPNLDKSLSNIWLNVCIEFAK